MRWVKPYLAIVALALTAAQAQIVSVTGAPSPRPGTLTEGGGATTPIFAMDCGAAGVDFPECAWEIETTYPGAGVAPHVKSLETTSPGLCSRGQYVRITFASGGAGDGSWGWGIEHAGWIALEPSAVQGSTRYLRWRQRVPTPFDWVNSSGGNGTKFIDFAQQAGDPGSSRAVTQIFGNTIGQLDLYPYVGGGGGPGPPLNDIGTDIWHNVQLRYVSSSTEEALDGEIHAYLGADNASISTPTGSDSGFAWDVEGWPGGDHPSAFLQIGSIISPIDAAHDDFVLDFCDFQYDDEFDADWNGAVIEIRQFFDQLEAANDDEWRLAA